MHVSNREFEEAVERAIAMIPGMFRAHLDNLSIVVEDRPSRDLIEMMAMPVGETLFGVFSGVPLPERTVTEPLLYPDEIIVFREPLMAACRSVEELEEEIAVTVVHEVAHFMGLSEERLEELGYG